MKLNIPLSERDLECVKNQVTQVGIDDEITTLFK
jgi:predicted DNA binding CopG/RHH family protein